jgi:hypothetical protein
MRSHCSPCACVFSLTPESWRNGVRIDDGCQTTSRLTCSSGNEYVFNKKLLYSVISIRSVSYQMLNISWKKSRRLILPIICIFFSDLCLCLPSGLFPPSFYRETVHSLIFSPDSCYMTCPLHTPWFQHVFHSYFQLWAPDFTLFIRVSNRFLTNIFVAFTVINWL